MKNLKKHISRGQSPKNTMRRAVNKQWGKIVLSGLVGLSTLSLGACSTTGAQHTGAAPIAYKADQGKFQNASARRPYSTATPYAGRSAYGSNTGRANGQTVNRIQGGNQNVPSTVQPYRPEAFTPMPKAAPTALDTAPKAVNFDPSTVDTDLYKHQRVGKRYTIMGKSYTPKHQPYYDVTGVASWYGDKFHGRPTATGELYDMDDITAAHKSLPLNSMVYVTNLETGKGMLVRVNDRGPFVDDRIIDLSRASARALGMFNSGLGKVRVQYAGPADPMAAKTNKKPIKRPSTPQVRKSDKTGQVAEVRQPQARQNRRPLNQLERLLPKAKDQDLSKLSPKYTPLRDLGLGSAGKSTGNSAPAQQASLPQVNGQKNSVKNGSNTGSTYQNPLLGYETQPNLTAPQNSQTAPSLSGDFSEPSTQDGPITLTIKGPIHMASDKATKGKKTAKFIPAVHYTTRTASTQPSTK